MKHLVWLSFALAIAGVQTGVPVVAAAQPKPNPVLHLFRETLDGGIQATVGDHGVSHEFIQRLRSELHRDATAYALGNYPNPDGRTSAVAKLRASAGRIHISYSDVPRGGAIVFKTSDSALVGALHSWMAATVRVNQKLHHDGGPGTYPLHDDGDGDG